MRYRIACFVLTGLLLLGMQAKSRNARQADVTIVSSRLNQRAFEKSGIDYRKGIRFWAALAADAGLSYRIAGDYELETGPKPSRVYVLHLAERLSDRQRRNIVRLRRRGTSILMVGMTGRLDRKGRARKSLPAEWLDLRNVSRYVAKDAAYFVTRGGTLSSLGGEPGFRFEFEWGGTYWLAGSRWAQGANVDWSLYPHPHRKGFDDNAVMAVRLLGNSRIAWFGVNPDAVIEDGSQQELIRATLSNLLRWAARKPVAEVCHWPKCRISAVVVTADVEDQFENGDAIALACRREGAKGSFFLLGNLSLKFPEVVTALAENGEIGTHSMYHKSFKGRALDSQLTELKQGVSTLQSLGVDEVVGVRPPMEEYDENTLKAVAAAGFRFIYGNLEYDRAYPVARRVDGKLLYQFARIVPDDYNINVDRNARDKASYEREYIEEFRRLYQYGGLYPFSFHTNYLARRESVGVIEETIRAFKRESVWMTTFGDIVDWMEARRGIEIRAEQKDGRVSIRIANRSGKPLNTLSLHYFPPSDAGEVRPVGTSEEGIEIHRAPREGYVISVDLRAGEEREIWLE